MSAPVLDGIGVPVPAAGTFMDVRGYRSQAFFDLEMRRVFPRSWLLVGDLDELGEPGDAITELIGFEWATVLREPSGELAVCSESFADARVDTWERFVFVNLTGDALPLLDYLERVPEILAGHEVAATLRTFALDDVIEANWKVFMDNAMCDYHVPFVHSTLLPMVADMRTAREDVGRFTNSLYLELSEFGLEAQELWPGLAGEAVTGTYAIGIFPNLLLIAFRDGGLHVLRWTPLALTSTRARVQAYAHEAPAADSFRANQVAIERLQAEDYAVVERVQAGLSSQQIGPLGPMHEWERRIEGFQRLLSEMLAEEIARV